MADFKRFRKVNDLTQEQAADLFGVSQAFISQIEKGLRPIPSEFISKISGSESLDSSMLLPDYETTQSTTQLEFDFNKWLEIEETKTETARINAESFQKVANTNEKLADTNSKLYEDNREIFSKLVESISRIEKKIDQKGGAEGVKDAVSKEGHG